MSLAFCNSLFISCYREIKSYFSNHFHKFGNLSANKTALEKTVLLLLSSAVSYTYVRLPCLGPTGSGWQGTVSSGLAEN